MKTMLMVLAMTVAAAAQEVMVVQEGAKDGETKQLRAASFQSASGTLLDMVDGTGGGWFYSEGGAGSSNHSGEPTRVVTSGGGSGMAMKAGPRSGGTLLDLIDR